MIMAEQIIPVDDDTNNKMITDETLTTAETTIPRGKPKSGKVWKDPKPHSLSKISKPKSLRSSWEKKMEEKHINLAVKNFEKQLKEDKKGRSEDLKRRQKLNKERKLLNERKGEVVQKVTNLKKLKRMKKKQLRSVETR